MAQSFVAEAHGTSASTAIPLTIPTGVQGQDVAFLAGATSTTTASVDAGWSLVGTLQNPISGATHGLWKKVMAGTVGSASSDVGSTVTFTPGAGVKSSATLTIWRGVDPSAPVNANAYNSVSPGTGVTTFTGPAVTTTLDGCTIVTIFADKNSIFPITFTPPSGYTSRSDGSNPNNTTGKSDAVQASKAGGSAGNYGADTWTATGTPGVVGIFTVALAPLTTTQTIRPTSDVSSSSVTGISDNTNLFNDIDENTLDTTDYIEYLSGGSYEFGLGTLSDPGVHTGWTVDYVLGLSGTASSASWTVTLYQGTTSIESWTDSNTTDGVVKSHALSSTNVANIVFTSGSVSNLRIKVVSTAVS